VADEQYNNKTSTKIVKKADAKQRVTPKEAPPSEKIAQAPTTRVLKRIQQKLNAQEPQPDY
jgi:hypothetical protein